MTIDTKCSNSGKNINIELDDKLQVIRCEDSADPMISVPMVNLVNTEEPSIVDIF